MRPKESLSRELLTCLLQGIPMTSLCMGLFLLCMGAS